jgi:mRNA interferase RelE/StbE
MKYSVLIGRRAQKAMGDLPVEMAARVRSAISSLTDNPRPPGCRKLTGRNEWRIRVSDYRVLYTIDDSTHAVHIVAVGHRRDIYG